MMNHSLEPRGSVTLPPLRDSFRDLLHDSHEPALQSTHEPRYHGTYQRAPPPQHLQINTQESSRHSSISYPGPSPLTSGTPSPAFPPPQQAHFDHYGSLPSNAYKHSPQTQQLQQPPNAAYGIPCYMDMPLRSRMNSMVSNPAVGPTGHRLSAARIASNDRHKLSEKHRRDAQGAFVSAGNVLRSGMTNARLFDCSVCSSLAISELSQAANMSMLPTPKSSFSGPSTPSQTVEAKPKIPKNDMLFESTLWEFGILLHKAPEMVKEKLEEVRALATSMEEEKMIGLRNSSMSKDGRKANKWESDVRSEVLFGLLDRMETSCREHGIAIGDDSRVPPSWIEVVGAVSRGKRGREDSDTDDDAERYSKAASREVPTPPSSRGSPVL